MIFRDTKKLILSFFLFAACFSAYAQVPQGINYQAIVRDAGGVPLPAGTATIGFTINFGSSSIFSEVHTGVPINEYGLINVVIGKGTPTGKTFEDVDWANTTIPITIETTVNGVSLGAAQPFQSVPYALHCATADSIVGVDLSTIGSSLPWTQGTNGYHTNERLGLGIAAQGDMELAIRSDQPYSIYSSQRYSGALPRYGVYSAVENGSGPGTGIYSELTQMSNFEAVGVASAVTQSGRQNAIGFQSTVSQISEFSAYGVLSEVSHSGTGSSYGYWISMIGSGSGLAAAYYAKFSSLSSGGDYGILIEGEEVNSFSGFLGVGVATPTQRLHVDGNMLLTKKFLTDKNGGANMIACAYGAARSDGAYASTTSGSQNYVVTRVSAGTYQIAIDSQTISNYINVSVAFSPVIIATNPPLIANHRIVNNSIEVEFRTASGVLTDTHFSFIVFKF